ncbi:MAG: L-threonylcarbamoyladenylate synthase [Planctomycetota bacterium]
MTASGRDPGLEDELDRAAEHLRAGGAVAIPTETVYGLAADALNRAAVRRVFGLKGRRSDNPLIVHVSGIGMARDLVLAWPDRAQALAERFWPGPLTLVLERSGRVPEVVTAGGPTVALRCPACAPTLELIRRFGGPLVAPSANPSGGVSPTSAEHVRGVWPEGEVPVLDAGLCEIGIESTVLDLTVSPARILRPGALGAGELALAVPGLEVVEAWAGASAAEGSPGRVGPHYRPGAPLRLARTVAEIGGLIGRAGGAVVVISPPGAPVTVGPPHRHLTMPADPAGYARELYAALREADALGPALIVVGEPRESPEWAAVLERLRRAAATD